MIKYALQCDKAHGFESWFPAMSSYESQVKRGFVECPVCGSVKIEKQIMSPTVRLGGFRKDELPLEAKPVPDVTAAPPAEGPLQPAALAVESEAAQKLRGMIREMHEHVKANTEDVGSQFAEEARKIHYGEVKERGIRGKATAEQAEALADEGIGFLPIPVLPEDRN